MWTFHRLQYCAGFKRDQNNWRLVSTVLHCKVDAVLLSALVLHHQHLQGHLSAVCCLLHSRLQVSLRVNAWRQTLEFRYKVVNSRSWTTGNRFKHSFKHSGLDLIGLDWVTTYNTIKLHYIQHFTSYPCWLGETRCLCFSICVPVAIIWSVISPVFVLSNIVVQHMISIFPAMVWVHSLKIRGQLPPTFCVHVRSTAWLRDERPAAPDFLYLCPIHCLVEIGEVEWVLLPAGWKGRIHCPATDLHCPEFLVCCWKERCLTGWVYWLLPAGWNCVWLYPTYIFLLLISDWGNYSEK